MRFLLVFSLAATLVGAAPAVASASTMTTFTSPSRTIACMYESFDGRVSVGCDLAHVDLPKPKPASCQGDYGDSFELQTHGKAYRRCHGDSIFGPHARVLPYGKTKHFGPFTCRVGKTMGMRCTSRSGHGFRVSRQHQRLW